MGVFGKKRTHRRLPRPLRDMSSMAREHGRRAIRGKVNWPIADSNLAWVQNRLNLDLIKLVKASHQKPVVVDWGCGKGIAITELAEKIRQAQCFGFSKEFYEDWTGNNRVKFIHGVAEDFLRYFKNNSIDVAYSFFGLLHSSGNPRTVLRNVLQVISKLKVGGKLIMEKSRTLEPMLFEKLDAAKFEISCEGAAMVITRNA